MSDPTERDDYYEPSIAKRRAPPYGNQFKDQRPLLVAEAGPAATDPTFELRRKQANLCEAVMVRVFDLEAQAAALTETAKKLRAAVLANT